MNQRRERGFRATDDGRKKLQQAKATRRNEKGKPLTYENIADKANISTETVERFFRGDAKDRSSAEAICRALGFEPIEIIDPNEWNRTKQYSQSQPTAKQKIAEIYRTWLQENTSHLIVPGFPEEFSMQSDWLPLRAKQHSGDLVPFEAKFIPKLYRLSVVTGEPGSGKSTFTKYLAHHLASSGKTVLRVRLPSVCKLLGNDNFGNAILRDAVGNSPLSLEQSQFALNTPDYLLADGLDECGDNRAVISEKLRDWATGHSTTRIIVTTRIDSEPEYLPGWQLLKLQPLEDSDIIEFAKRLLGDLFDENKFKSWLQKSETTSLAAKNPLLLGFLIQIFREHDEPIQNRAKLYEKIIDLAYKQPLQDKEPISLEEPTAKRILEIVGWELLNNPQCSESDLWNNVGKKLERELNVPLLQAKNQAKEGMLFWEQRRILERIKIGCDDVIIFLHLTIGEYAAGRYACEMESDNFDNFCQWLTKVNQNHVWRESIFFAAELGAVESIIHHLLQLDDREVANSNEILLAAKILQRSTDPPVELIKQVVNRLKNGLESPTQSVVFKTAEILLSLSLNAPELISTVSQPYLQHSQSWKRLVAITLSLGSKNECIDINEVEQQIDEIILEAEKYKQNYSLSKNIFLSPIIDDLKIQFLVKSCEYLFREQLSPENFYRIKKIKAIINSGEFRFDAIRKLKIIVRQKYFAVKQKEVYTGSQQLLRELCDFGSTTYLEKDILRQKQSLEKMKSQQQKGVDRLFLESIIRILKLECSSMSGLPENIPQQHFILLGVLVRGLGCWNIGIRQWDAIGQSPNSEVIDAVLKGAIVAMDLDRQELATESATLLDRLNNNGKNLHEIEFLLLNPIDNYEKLISVWDDDRLYISLFRSIPQVPADPQWERVKSVEFPIQTLTDALDHPSVIIESNAYKILCQKIGEDRVMEIFREKGLIS